MLNTEMIVDLVALVLVSIYACNLLFVYESGHRAPHDVDYSVRVPMFSKIKFLSVGKRSLLNQRVFKKV